MRPARRPALRDELISFLFLSAGGVLSGWLYGRSRPAPPGALLVCWPLVGVAVALVSRAVLKDGAPPASHPLYYFTAFGVAASVTARRRGRAEGERTPPRQADRREQKSAI